MPAAAAGFAVRTELATPFRQQPEVQLSVGDRGMGIPTRDLPHIFEPFYRVASVREGEIRGVGLGLYLVKRAMEGMGGRSQCHQRGRARQLLYAAFPAGAHRGE